MLQTLWIIYILLAENFKAKINFKAKKKKTLKQKYFLF